MSFHAQTRRQIMGEQEIRERVIKIVREGLQPVKMTDDEVLNADLKEKLGADSLDLYELTMEIEEEFNVAIEDEEANELKTAKQIVAYIVRKLN